GRIERELRERQQEEHGGQREHLRVAPQQDQRAERIGVPPIDSRGAALFRQGFRQHEEAVGEIQQRQSRRDPEWQTDPLMSQEAAERGAYYETERERAAQCAERRSPLL